MERISPMLLALGLLVGCQETNPRLSSIELDRTSTLEGIDADSNGVRDDIDRYVLENSANEGQRKALLQNARSMQMALLVKAGDVPAARLVAHHMARSVRCVSSMFPVSEGVGMAGILGRELETITTNTRLRLRAYLAFAKTLDGTSWTLPTGDTCE